MKPQSVNLVKDGMAKAQVHKSKPWSSCMVFDSDRKAIKGGSKQGGARGVGSWLLYGRRLRYPYGPARLFVGLICGSSLNAPAPWGLSAPSTSAPTSCQHQPSGTSWIDWVLQWPQKYFSQKNCPRIFILIKLRNAWCRNTTLWTTQFRPWHWRQLIWSPSSILWISENTGDRYCPSLGLSHEHVS